MEEKITFDKLKPGRYYKTNRDVLFKFDCIEETDKNGHIELIASEALNIFIGKDYKMVEHINHHEYYIWAHPSDVFKEIDEKLFGKLVKLHLNYCNIINDLTKDIMDIK